MSTNTSRSARSDAAAQTAEKNPYRQYPVEDVLDFCVDLSRRMIVSGANIERVSIAVERICNNYELTDLSIFMLSTHITVSTRDANGRYATRQAAIPPAGIHLSRLQSLNRLCYKVTEIKPSPRDLKRFLKKASNVKEYSDFAILLAQIFAMCCLCLIFGGWLRELFCVAVIVTAIHYLFIVLAIPGIDRILSNALTMWVATAIALFFMHIGISDREPVIIITFSLLVIPGIPLVNAMRNLLCGNEMNGILQLIRVTVETMALAMGIYVAILMFGNPSELNEAVVSAISNPAVLIILSFGASFALSAVFRVQPQDLWLGGLGGVLTRITMLLLSPICPRLGFVTASAFVASLYAETLATIQKKPSTYYTYPSIIPLIPGDLFYYTLVGVYNGDRAMVASNGINCALSLASMSIGFVLSSVVAHYWRKMKL